MKRMACLWLPVWPIQRLVAERPALKGTAVVLHAVEPRRGVWVVACSRRASRCGVRVGMPLSEALALCSRQGESPASGPVRVHVERHQDTADRAALEDLAVACERFSPRVGFELAEWDLPPAARGRMGTAAGPSCVYLEITQLGVHFGGETGWATQCLQFLERRGYHVRLGVADTLGAAWAAAHFGSRWAQPLSGPGSPGNGSSAWIIPVAATATALQPLPLAALRLPDATSAALQQVGVCRIGQLATLPRAGLASRFGTALLTRWDQALGVQDELWEPYRPPPVFQAERLLEHPTQQIATIRAVLDELVRQVVTLLAAHGQGALELVGRLDCLPVHDGQGQFRPSLVEPNTVARSWPLRVGLFQPTACAKHLLELLEMQLDQLRLPGLVEYVAVQVPVAARLETHQHVLFSAATGPTPGPLAHLLERLAGRLGAERIVRPVLQDEAQPERAYGYRTPAGWRAVRNRARTPAMAVHGPNGARPLALWSPPLPVEVVAVMPDGPPARFCFQRQTYPVARYWGPERIETGWWRGRSVRRDYYRVETAQGHRFWLFRQLHDQQWFLHGMYQ